MAKLVFIKKEDKKGVFKLPHRTNYFLPKRKTCPPKRGRMVTLPFNPHWEMGKTFSPSYSSSQITYVEAEAVCFSRFRFRFHRKRTASTASASSFRFRFHIPVLNPNVTDSGFLGDAVVYNLKQGFFLMLICCLLRYLCLYFTAL